MEKNKRDIHDENFKHNFTSKNVAHDFLKHNLPKKVLCRVDIGTVEVERNEFIPSKYRSKRSADVLYSVKDKQGRKVYALLHLEGQSDHDRYMAMRVFEYHAAIVRAHLRKNYTKVPLILTFVLYHGKAKWSSAKSVADLFDDFDLYIEVAFKCPFLIDLKEIEFKALKSQEAAAAPQMIMKGKVKGDYCQMLPDLYPLMKKYDQVDEENIDYIATLDKHEEFLFLEKLSKFDAETATDYRTMFEAAIQREHEKALKLGISRGKLEGIEEGKQEGKVEIAKQMLCEREEHKKIARYTALSLREIEALAASL